MHSSRMRTVRSSSRFSWRGMSASVHAEIPTPRDDVPPGTMHPPGSCTSPFLGTRHPPGPCTPLPQDHASPGTMHPPRGHTDTCKNITFATSLRTVIIAVLRTSTAHDLTLYHVSTYSTFLDSMINLQNRISTLLTYICGSLVVFEEW